MAYSTESELETLIGHDALVELSDLDNTAGIDSTRVAAAIQKADGVIDSYINKRYAVPLASPPDSIKTLSAEWAIRVLRTRRYKGQPITEDQDAEKIDREWLDGVAKGRISLGVEPQPTKSSLIVDKAAPRDSTLAISMERMKGFI